MRAQGVCSREWRITLYKWSIQTNTHTHRHLLSWPYWLYKTKFTHNSKWAARIKTAAWNRKHGRSIVLEKEMFWCLTWRSSERGYVGEEGEVIPCCGTKDRKGAGTNSGESGMRNLDFLHFFNNYFCSEQKGIGEHSLPHSAPDALCSFKLASTGIDLDSPSHLCTFLKRKLELS